LTGRKRERILAAASEVAGADPLTSLAEYHRPGTGIMVIFWEERNIKNRLARGTVKN
jgi:hypothetical protein